VAGTLLSGKDYDNKPLFRNKAFWAGFLAVFCIHLMNGYHGWNDQFPLHMPLQYSFPQVATRWPILSKAEWGGNFYTPMLNFTAMAFAFFLASDIGLSLGISQMIYVPLSAILVTYGVDTKSAYMQGGLSAFQRFGGFMAFAVIMLYVGRRYYADLLKRTFLFVRQEGVSASEAVAARVFFVVVFAMIAMLCLLGLNLPMSIMLIVMVLVTYLTVARISAETGLFFIQPRWQPMGVLLGLFGYFAMGPVAIIIVGLTCIVLCFDPSQALMPYLTNALRVCDRLGAKIGRVSFAAGGTYVLCLVIAVTVTLWANYNWPLYEWAFFTRITPKASFDEASTAITNLTTTDKLEESLHLTDLQRLANVDPKPIFLWGAGVGFGLVLLLSALRLRFTWWPLHPVFLLVWGTWPMVRLSHSFFLGWLIKVIVTRLGGGSAYQAAKPLMVGVIAGDLLGAGIWEVVGAIYYAIYNVTGSSYWVFPH
jgi:hypothetical protein